MRCHSGHSIGLLAANVARQHIARFPLCQGDQAAFMIFADNGVTFPVAHSALLLYNCRTFVNTDTVFQHAAPFLPACITLTMWFLASSMLVQVAAVFRVCIDVPADGFVTDRQAAFQSKPMRNLFRTEVRSDQPLDISPLMRRDAFAIEAASFAFVPKRLCLFRPPAALAFVAAQLP